ncbi:hypothetical protein NL676_025495 [Syzygium grande]|nr:hypothetical protein NL676_025495 [Syzygium grande]
MAYLAVEATLRLVEIVSSLILKEINQKKDVKEDIDCITSWLKTMRAFLSDLEGTQGNQCLQDKVHQIRDFAYDIEDAFDEFMFRVPQHVHTHSITKFGHKVAHLAPQKRALHEISSRIKEIRIKIQNFRDLEYLRTGNTSSGESRSSGHVERIRDQLLSGQPRLSTISIVGPPGSGKTVLARQVFECKRVQGLFYFHAWVHVSPSSKPQELLRSILTQFFPWMDGSDLINGVAVREIFSKHNMQQKRFIVVLDDIWRMQDWERIANALQIGSGGSTILVTSRNSDVGSTCAGCPEYVHKLNALPYETALSLFCKKAFRSCNGTCPPELDEWSKKIIKKCEGLPLAVIAAGNLLSKKGHIPHEWKKLHDSLGANLPVMGSILAEEENFVGSASERSSSSQGRIRRLSAQTDIRTNVELSATLDHVRSAFMFGRGKFSDLKLFQLLKILDMQGAPLGDFPIHIVKLVLLKYLSLRETNIKTVPKSIKKLALLETLDLKRTSVTRLPGSIFQLHLLRHLLVYGYNVKNSVTFDGAKGVEMHSGRGALSNIRKLSLVMATTELIKKLVGMIHLRKLGLINLKSKDGRKVCESIQKMEHLSTLDLRAESGDHLELDHIQIKPGFVFLRHLYLKGQLQKLPKWVSSLQSLIKVGLKWSRLNINPLQALQDLPNLMDLNMVDAFTGQTLEFKANTFRKLSIVDLQVNAMPALEKLTFRKCEKLDTLPFGINRLTNLQELLLYGMNGEFIDRLRKNSEDRNLVSHVRVIRSYTLSEDQYWLPQNLS